MPRDLMSYFSLKRLFDFLAALFLLIALLPLLAIILLVVYCILFEWPIFTQKRMGRAGISFKMFKVKSMKTGHCSPSTHFVIKALRSTGLDELPQIWNIFKGDMSFIGPRPLPLTYKNLIKIEHRRRDRVLPGITGLAQVSGGNSLNWHARFELDIQYVNKLTFILDLDIFIKTLKLVFSGRDTHSKVLTADY